MGGEEKVAISRKLDENVAYLKKRLGIGVANFDVIFKEFNIDGRRMALIYVDGLNNNMITALILTALVKLKREDLAPKALDKLLLSLIPFAEITPISDLELSITEMLAGPMVLYIDGERQALVIDNRQFPIRSPEEPDIEKVTRGSRDGFVETLVFNIALIRRRIRDPRLRVEVLKIGRRSVSDVALIYIQDIAYPQIVDTVRERLKKINLDALPMAEKTIEEFITVQYWNPFPEVRYTERPDVAAVHLIEGHVLIVVDTSPSVMIAPVTFFHHLQHAEEYRHDAIIGTYIRWMRMIGVFLSFVLVPLWLLLAMEPQYLPEGLDFIGPEEKASIPLFIQFIIAHFGLDLLRMASIHTPSPFATALGLVGGLLIGQIAVEVGFFVPEVLLYTGLVAMGVFSTPSWELSMANRVVLLLMLILTGLFQLPGLLLAFALVLVRLLTTKSFGFPYLWPLIPFDFKGFTGILIRRPAPLQRFRPSYLRTLDKDRTRKR